MSTTKITPLDIANHKIGQLLKILDKASITYDYKIDAFVDDGWHASEDLIIFVILQIYGLQMITIPITFAMDKNYDLSIFWHCDDTYARMGGSSEDFLLVILNFIRLEGIEGE